MSSFTRYILIVLLIAIVPMMVSCRMQETLELRAVESVVVAQSPDDVDVQWGSWQFPKMGHSINGIYITFTGDDALDDVRNYEDKRKCYVSNDDGRTWDEAPVEQLVITDYPMNNGMLFQGFVPENGYCCDWVEKYKPVFMEDEATGGSLRIFLASDINEFRKYAICREYDPITGSINTFQSKFIWDGMPVVARGNTIMPVGAWAYLSSVIASSGKLYLAMYSYGLDSANMKPTNDKYNVYFFVSDDAARTWHYTGQLLSADYLDEASFDGLAEPCLTRGDKAFYVAMRSGAGQPLYFSSSDDFCTWSSPEMIIGHGVSPQIVHNDDSGMFILSYGRPGIYAAVSNNQLEKWTDPITLNVGGETVAESVSSSCCYTALLPLSDRAFLMAYSDFNYPSNSENGGTRKTILVSKIEMIPR